MPAEIRTEVLGVKETIKALRNLDPEFRKQFNRAAKDVVAPMVAEAKSLYPQLPLSGMARPWTPKSYSIFPWQVAKVRSGVKVKTSIRRNNNSVLYVSQGEPAGILFEAVSASTRLGANLRARNDRVLWPTADKHAPRIAAGIEKIVQEAERVIQEAVA